VKPEDPDCPFPLKLMAIRALEEQIQDIKDSMDWDRNISMAVVFYEKHGPSNIKAEERTDGPKS